MRNTNTIRYRSRKSMLSFVTNTPNFPCIDRFFLPYRHLPNIQVPWVGPSVPSVQSNVSTPHSFHADIHFVIRVRSNRDHNVTYVGPPYEKNTKSILCEPTDRKDLRFELGHCLIPYRIGHLYALQKSFVSVEHKLVENALGLNILRIHDCVSRIR